MAPINKITREDVRDFRERRTMAAYQHAATRSAFYPGQGTAIGLAYAALKLNGEAGELAEHVGKAMRDDNYGALDVESDGGEHYPYVHSDLTPERHALIVKEVGDVLWYLVALCNELGIALSDVAHGNLTKLCDRGERDKLQGSGDDR